jgi:hypothetical protein
MRRPEVVDVLNELAEAPLTEVFQRMVPGVAVDAESCVRALAQALVAYRDEPLDDAPELVEGLAFVAWVLQGAAAGREPSESPAVAYA